MKAAIIVYDANYMLFNKRKSYKDNKKLRDCPRFFTFCCCNPGETRFILVPRLQSIIVQQFSAAGATGNWSETSKIKNRKNECADLVLN